MSILGAVPFLAILMQLVLAETGKRLFVNSNMILNGNFLDLLKKTFLN